MIRVKASSAGHNTPRSLRRVDTTYSGCTRNIGSFAMPRFPSPTPHDSGVAMTAFGGILEKRLGPQQKSPGESHEGAHHRREGGGRRRNEPQIRPRGASADHLL